ncbi:MAG TPA: TfuA-like protein [Streptosporangiaceae bacterium]|nr:TfuA-like protein [Streptosporangiaceae bacterium]
MNDIYVFLGPTLAEKDARAELDAVYLPPVSAGDVYRLWRRRPRAVGIIDGYFDRVPAVWHKEIMWVMEHGVHVFGAAGLGALRAAELDRFGMHGTGWVYQAFSEGSLDRDDEVAVGPGSEAMVNIRRTLAAAEQQGIISAATAGVLLTAGTALFYPERTWPELLRAAGATRADAAELDALRRWLPDGRVDQQAADAAAMLREMRGFLAADPAPQQVSWSMADTAMWEAAKRRADALPRDGAAGSRPMLEPVLDEIRLAGPGAYEAACCRSLLRVFAADFAGREGVAVDGERLHDAVAAFRISRHLEHGTALTRFLADNDLSAEEFDRLIVTDEMVRWACGQAEWAAFGDLLDDLRLNGEYAQLVARARAKLDDDVPSGTPAEGQAAIEWYFAQRRGTAVPDDLAGYAQSCGFPDEQAFLTAVWHDYRHGS